MKKVFLVVFAMMFSFSIALAQSQQCDIEEADGIENTIANSEDNTGLLDETLPMIEGSVLTEKQLEQTLLLYTKDPNRITAGILAILLGDFGVQHFYTGQTVRGVLDILFCWTGIPAIIGIAEGIIWLTEDDDAWAERVEEWKSNK